MDWRKWIVKQRRKEGSYAAIARTLECADVKRSPRLVQFLCTGERPFTWASKIAFAQAYPELRVFLALEIGKGWGGGER